MISQNIPHEAFPLRAAQVELHSTTDAHISYGTTLHPNH